MDELKAPPRNRVVGTVADALLAAKQAGGPVGDFVLGDLPAYADNASYGDWRLWRGGLQTGKLAPGAVDAVSFAAPLAVGTAKAGKTLANIVTSGPASGGRLAQRGAVRVPALKKVDLAKKLEELTGGKGLHAVQVNDASRAVRNEMRAAGNLSGPAEKLFTDDPEVAKLVKLLEGMQRKSNFLYHGTPAENLDSIKQLGLLPDKAKRFPGVSQNYSYFSTSPEGARYFTGPQASLLRTKKNLEIADLVEDFLGGDGSYMTGTAISPENLEVLLNGRWVPLK